jgi:putative phosphoesterase
MLVGVIADTHMAGGRHTLPGACVERLAGCELIVHAGDVMTGEALESIEAIGPPVAAVLGNVDAPELRRQLPPELLLELAGGVRLGVVHDAGPKTGRLERMRTRFPDAHAVVFGHSHMPLHERAGGFQIFNPGSPTARRRAPAHSMGLAHVDAGEISFELVTL